ncbi:MAG: hypothetical protein M3122_00980 [Actinomycetota bacterium]|nr:hypothetical protein [Actinomycetota bacterium]
MKSWKTRLGLVLTMLALVLAVSVPAVAEDDNCGDRCENRLDRPEDVFGFDIDEDDLDRDDIEDIRDFEFDDDDFEDISFEVEDVKFFCGDDDGDGLVNEDDSGGIDDDLDGLFDEDNFTECDELIAVVEIDLDDFDLDGILDLNNDDDNNDGIFNFDDDDDDNDDN